MSPTGTLAPRGIVHHESQSTWEGSATYASKWSKECLCGIIGEGILEELEAVAMSGEKDDPE